MIQHFSFHLGFQRLYQGIYLVAILIQLWNDKKYLQFANAFSIHYKNVYTKNINQVRKSYLEKQVRKDCVTNIYHWYRHYKWLLNKLVSDFNRNFEAQRIFLWKRFKLLLLLYNTTKFVKEPSVSTFGKVLATAHRIMTMLQITIV